MWPFSIRRAQTYLDTSVNPILAAEGVDEFLIERQDAVFRSFFVSGFVVMIGVGRGCRALRSRDGVSAVEPDEPAHVGGEVGQADLHFRPPQTDRANDEAHRPFLVSEHMLDRGADFRLERIGAPGALGHRLALGLLAVIRETRPRDFSIASVLAERSAVSAHTSLAVFVASSTSASRAPS
jgi:hypothetical protein